MSFHFIGLLIQHIYLKITCTRDQHVLQRPMRFKYYSEAAFVTAILGNLIGQTWQLSGQIGILRRKLRQDRSRARTGVLMAKWDFGTKWT